MKKRYLLLFFMAGLVLLNACQHEYSFESGNGPSVGTLQDGGTGDCLPKTVSGAYVVGTALAAAANYIEVQVDVIQPGTYVIYTDTVNGMFFRISGVFTTAGLTTVQLKGNGTPQAAGINNFLVHYGISGCTVAVTTVTTLATFTLDGAPGGCMGAVVNGTYAAGTALTASNNVTISVNVTATGAYNIQTVVSNGMIFIASGIFTTTGTQTIVLNGTGTPASPGSTNIPVTSGSSNCSFTVSVGGGAIFTITCASTVVSGTYTAGIALTSSANTATLSVNVTTVGAFSINTTPINGMTFSANGTFAATGATTVVLAGSGMPTNSGATTVSLATGSCTFPVTVVPGAAPGVFTMNCPSTVVNGTYTVNTLLAASNTAIISVNVTTLGTYNISTTPNNGMTFSASGTFTVTGVQTVTLAGSGTPANSGITTVAFPTGTCTFPVTVAPSSGPATFTVTCGSAVVNGTYTAGIALTATNTVALGINVTALGSYTITTTLNNGVTFSSMGTFTSPGIQTVTLTGNGIPATSGTFTIQVPSGTIPCSFSLIVDPASTTTATGTWSFKVGTTTISGTFDDAGIDLTTLPAPYILWYMDGPDATGNNYFELDFADASGALTTGEIYTCATITAGSNFGGYYYDGPPPNFDPIYEADPSITPNNMSIHIVSHNTATKTIMGTFTGNAKDASDNPIAITNGTFTLTYP